VAHAVGDAGGGQVAVEHVVVVLGLGSEPFDLLRSPVVAGVGIDRDELDPRLGADASTIMLRPRKLPISTIRCPGAAVRAASYRRRA
jgi:hypothetical protein